MSDFLGSAGVENGERASLLSVQSIKPPPDTLTSMCQCLCRRIHSVAHDISELIKRLRVLTLALLPVEVDPAGINDPTSRVITPEVISAYRAAAGDFVEAVSSALNFGCDS